MQLFEPFREEYIGGFLKQNIFYLVSQTYHAAEGQPGEEAGTPILLTQYPDEGYAAVHFNAVKKDRYASIIDLRKQKHINKLREMINPDSKYRVYLAAIRDSTSIKRHFEVHYKEKIRQYITQRTNWKIGTDEQIKPALELIFGELFVVLKRKQETIRIELKDLKRL